ncbi:phosphotransferase [Mycolicibacterium sp. XJ1819]
MPRSPADITPAWLSQALAAEVTSVGIREIIGGTATKVLLDIGYSGTPPFPEAMCFKGGLGEHALFMAPVGIYATEARFFRDERPHSEVTTPEVFWADVDEDLFGGILMEDLSRPSVRFGSALTPLSADEVAAVLDSIAVLHASRWNSPWLNTADWLEHFADPDSRGRAYFSMLGADVVSEFIAKRRDVLPTQLRDAQHCLELFWGYVANSERKPQTLLHGDLHPGNIYFDGDRVGLCDWQVLGRGSPAFDLAYLLGSAMTAQERRDNERDLLRHYLDALASAGITTAPAAEELWHLYRIHMAYGMFAWLTNPEAFQSAKIIRETLARLATAVVDLDTAQAVGAAR